MKNLAHTLEIDVTGSFVAETRERIERASQYALQIESGQQDALSAVLAEVHGLKGTAAVAEVDDLARASHRLEDVLNALRSEDPVFSNKPELNELIAQTVLDFCDFASAYCDALVSNTSPPQPPSFLSDEERPLSSAKMPPFETAHGIRGVWEQGTVSIVVPKGVTAAELQSALIEFQRYMGGTPRGTLWIVDLSQVHIIDLSFMGELYVIQELLKERHGTMKLTGVRRTAVSPALLERVQRRFRTELLDAPGAERV